MKDSKFVSLFNDLTFRSIWNNGKVYAKEYLYRLIESILGYKVDNYNLVTRRIGDNYLKGLLFISEDNLSKIFIEFNNSKRSNVVLNKDDLLSIIADDFYQTDKDLYLSSIRIDYIRFNSCKNYNKDIISCWKLFDSGINFFDVNLCNLSEDMVSERDIDLKMLVANNYDEMEQLVADDVLRKFLFNELKKLSCNKKFCDSYDYVNYIDKLISMKVDYDI